MLWFLNLCAANGIVVISYTDDAQGTMAEEAHRLCFIARSVNFPVSCEPVIT
jgi:organic hydroperoxide reductase OsmC/OhrA